MAPEVLGMEGSDPQYNFKADIFSLGAVLFFLCFNKHAFRPRESLTLFLTPL